LIFYLKKNFQKSRIFIESYFKKLFLTITWVIAAVAINQLGQRNFFAQNAWFAAMLSISLLAWFLSILILLLGTCNIINFPTLAGCHWILQVTR